MPYLLRATYSVLLVGLGLYGLKVLAFTVAYMIVRGRREVAPELREQPTVTVQLPIYNERFVAARAIDAACRLRWPADRLQIQVLDDSTDETVGIVSSAVAAWQSRGADVAVIRRRRRDGFKAGALANGLKLARGELVAVLDADFVPAPDFLERTVPHFAADVGAVQARWGHLNAQQCLVTRIQSVALDGYFVVEQTVRSRLGLFVNFNGTAGVWRKAAIVDAGGWQGDSLAEDTDLSFRAQMAGWRVVFLPDVSIPAELPADMASFKRQQRRWATGTTQLLLKLGPRLVRSRHHPIVRAHAFLTLGGHLMQPLTLLALLGAPLLLLHPPGFPPILGLLGILALAPPVMYAIALVTLYRRWARRLAVYPALALVALGMSLNGSVAVARALLHRGGAFERTPKRGSAAGLQASRARAPTDGAMRIDSIVCGEILLACYAFAILAVSVSTGRLGWTPLLALFGAGYALTAGLSLAPWLQDAADRRRRPATIARLPRTARVAPRIRPEPALSGGRPSALQADQSSAGRGPVQRGADRVPR